MSTQLRRSLIFGAMAALVATGFIACSDSGNDGGGTTPTITISAPGIVSPQGAITENPPTLVVANVTVSDGSGATYTFQVATDQAFADIFRQVTGLAQGSGQTSWTMGAALPSGTYYWRARAVAGGVNGPWSSVAELNNGGAVSPQAGETVVVFDPLTNGMTLGQQFGGTFTSQGWRVDNLADFLRYEIPTVTDGYAQWENVGLTPRGANINALMLFGMWDPTAGAYRQNPYRVHLQKRFGPQHTPPFFRLRWISGGVEGEVANNGPVWDPGSVYTFRVDWGPRGAAHRARVFVDGVERLSHGYNRPYTPNTHFIELGIGERSESVIDATYRNFTVVRR